MTAGLARHVDVSRRVVAMISSVAGCVARQGSVVDNLTKFGVGAFSESRHREGFAPRRV